jgi:hypothetical protein
MSRNYKFKNPEGVFSVSFAVVEWLDVFESWSNNVIDEKINYIHQNTVEDGLVFKAQD